MLRTFVSGLTPAAFAGVASAQSGAGACHTFFCDFTQVALALLLAVAFAWSCVVRFRRGRATSHAPVSFGGKLLLGLVSLVIILLSAWLAVVTLSGNS